MAKIVYDPVLEQVVKHIGVNVEKQASVDAVARDLHLREGIVQRVKSMLEITESIQTRFEMTRDPAKGRYPTGRNAYWTITRTLPEIREEIVRRKLGWDNKTFIAASRAWQKAHHPARIKVENEADLKAFAGSQPSLKEGQVAIGTGPEGEIMAQAGPDAPTPLSALAGARHDDAEALIEAARQYRDRAKWVETQLQSFRDQGIEVDPSAIKVPRDRRLDDICLVLPVIDQLTTQVARQNERILASKGFQSELQEARRATVSAQNQINRLLTERGTKQEEHTAEVAKVKNASGERIRELERQLEDANKNVRHYRDMEAQRKTAAATTPTEGATA